MNIRSWSIGKKLWALSFLFMAVLMLSLGTARHQTTLLTLSLKEIVYVQLPGVRYTTLSDMMHDAIRS